MAERVGSEDGDSFRVVVIDAGGEANRLRRSLISIQLSCKLAEHYEKCRPELETFGGNVIHLGPLGSGLIAKLVNNTLHAAHYALARDALVAGTRLGLDEQALGRALSVSSGNSFSLNTAVAVGGFEVLAPMVGPLLRKDIGIFDRLTAGRDAPTGALIAVADEALQLFGYPRDQTEAEERT